jgi:hypothetical protein
MQSQDQATIGEFARAQLPSSRWQGNASFEPAVGQFDPVDRRATGFPWQRPLANDDQIVRLQEEVQMIRLYTR